MSQTVELDPNDVIECSGRQHSKWKPPTKVTKVKHVIRQGGEVTVDLVTDGVGFAARKTYEKWEFTPKEDAVPTVELEIYRTLSDFPYSCRLLGALQKNNKKGKPRLEVYIQPWCGTSLAEFLSREVSRATSWFWEMQQSHQDQKVLAWILECSHAVYLLHKRNPPIIHHKIQPSNIMIDSETKRILLVDFGIARVRSDGTSTICNYPTPEYESPERRRNGMPNRKTDVFGLGCVGAELLVLLMGGKVSEFRKWRKLKMVIGVDGKPVEPERRVRFSDDVVDCSFAENLESVRSYFQFHFSEQSHIREIAGVILECLEEQPRLRLSAKDAYTRLRSLILPLLPVAALGSFPPPAIPGQPSTSPDDAQSVSSDEDEDSFQAPTKSFEWMSLKVDQ